jgi:4-amino-4-deoxy-L-arabinose transferase-like glycosyltransferase
MPSLLSVIEKKYVIAAYLLLAAIYIAGLFVRLMNNDAGEYALVALNMAQKNDFINIFRKGEDYLDKPHLLFWLSAISFKMFGVNGVAYKLPSLLFSLVAIYSTTRLGAILFDKRTGIIAGLVLGYSQAFIIANHDVRTDAILTGATAFDIYQFLKFTTNKRYTHILLGAFGLSLAVGTKGMIAVIVTSVVITFHLLYHRRIKEIFSWQWLSSIVWFFIFLSPFLYCYYQQFDAHPEKITNGVKGMSGIKFLLWTQSFERLAGQRNMVNNNDFLFFFHTFLWAFLPWSIIAYYETFRDWIILARNRFKVTPDVEFTLSGSSLIVMLLMSTSQFKLPHYLNILFPLFAIITAKAIVRLIEERKALPQWIKLCMYIIAALYFLLGIVLNGWAFPVQSISLVVLAAVAVIILVAIIFSHQLFLLKPVFVALLTVGVVNLFLNISFFPKILAYQGSSSLADYVNNNKIPPEQISSFTSRRYFAFDFYIQRDTPEPDLQTINRKSVSNESFYIIADKLKQQELEGAGIPVHTIKVVPHFHVSRLKGKFINPGTRTSSLDSLMLIKVN